MGFAFNPIARKLGVWCAAGTGIVGILYAAVLVAGLLSLRSPDEPIGDPLFSILEIMIIVMMPLMIGTMVALNAWAAADVEALSLMALVFVSLLAGITCCVHFVILTVSRHPAFASLPGMPLFLSFKWPSFVYALDILAWDVLFPLGALCAAPVFRGGRLASTIRGVLIASGVLAFAGLAGVAVDDMQIRNIGIVGYGGAFPVASIMMAVLFHRTAPRTEASLSMKGT